MEEENDIYDSDDNSDTSSVTSEKIIKKNKI